MRLPFEEKAAEELEAVAQFYERERAGYGRLFLTEVSKKYQPHEIAREMADPSKIINKDYATVRIVIDGKTYQGLVVEETANAWKLKPFEKLLIECEPTVIKKVDFIEGETADRSPG